MSSMLRTFWIWLLVLALPVQGHAAATMLLCGSGPQRVHTTAHDKAHTHPHAAAGHGSYAAGAGQAVAPDGASAAVPTADGASHDHPGQHGCSACAACCVAMALPSRAPMLAEPVAAVVVMPRVRATAPSFVTGGPERPPRTPLA